MRARTPNRSARTPARTLSFSATRNPLAVPAWAKARVSKPSSKDATVALVSCMDATRLRLCTASSTSGQRARSDAASVTVASDRADPSPACSGRWSPAADAARGVAVLPGDTPDPVGLPGDTSDPVGLPGDTPDPVGLPGETSDPTDPDPLAAAGRGGPSPRSPRGGAAAGPLGRAGAVRLAADGLCAWSVAGCALTLRS